MLQNWEEWEEMSLTRNHTRVFDLWVLKPIPCLFQTVVKLKGFCRTFQFIEAANADEVKASFRSAEVMSYLKYK